MSWTSKSIKVLALDVLFAITFLAVLGHATGIYTEGGISTLLHTVNSTLSAAIAMGESVIDMLLEIVAAIIIGVMVAVEGILGALPGMFN